MKSWKALSAAVFVALAAQATRAQPWASSDESLGVAFDQSLVAVAASPARKIIAASRGPAPRITFHVLVIIKPRTDIPAGSCVRASGSGPCPHLVAEANDRLTAAQSRAFTQDIPRLIQEYTRGQVAWKTDVKISPHPWSSATYDAHGDVRTEDGSQINRGLGPKAWAHGTISKYYYH